MSWAAAIHKPSPSRTRKRSSSMLDSASLPVESLAKLAIREGRRPVPIYQAHRWFARRFSSAFRAILTAAKLESDDEFWEAYYRGVDYAREIVLDPFVGGGTSVVEAARLGATPVGVDIDPVACAITRFELHAAEVPDLSVGVNKLQRTVGARLARYYRTVGARGDQRLVLHAFWVQVVDCHKCGVASEAHPHYQLAYESEGTRQWAFCRSCHTVVELSRDQKSFRCKVCDARTVIGAGPVTHGQFNCPTCKAAEALIDLAARTGRPPNWRLFALETVPSGSNDRRLPMTERCFQAATAADQERLKAAHRALNRRKKVPAGWRWIPDRAIPTVGRSDDRLIQYGYEKYSDLFNPRQLLHLSVLAESIIRLKGPTREALALAFSDHLTTNCMLTHYAFGWRRLAPLFSIRAFRHVTRPVEINPWLDGTGRGTFPNNARQVQRAVTFAQAPEVAHLDGGFVRSGTLSIDGNSTQRSVYHGDSRKLAAINDESVDFILTDPPYCDNIAYSELSDFFLPWMSQFGLTPNAASPSGMSCNLAAQSRGAASVATFKAGLSECFLQMQRVLKNDGRLVFSYQHRTPDAWEALATALAAGSWCPIQVFPLLGNSPAGLHQHDGTILWDAVTVCRKGTLDADHRDRLRVSNLQISAAIVRAAAWASRLKRARISSFRAADQENLLRAMLVAVALGAFGISGRGKRRSLLDVLAKTPSDLTV